eukprot:UN01299
MWKREVQPEEMIIKQGEDGDFFYIIESGEFEVFIESGNGERSQVSNLGPATSFGGLALMYNAPRNASVKVKYIIVT